MQQNSLEDFQTFLKILETEDLTLDTLSKYLGVSDVYVSKLENGSTFHLKIFYFGMYCLWINLKCMMILKNY